MRNTKFKKGQRVVIIDCDEWDTENYKYKLGYKGTVNENTDYSPFILFDNEEANYTIKGTAVAEFQFKIIKDKTNDNDSKGNQQQS